MVIVSFVDGPKWQFVHYISDCHSIWMNGREYAIADESAINMDNEHYGPEHTDDGVLYIDRKKPILVNDNKKIVIPLFKKVGDFEKEEPTSSLCSWKEALWLHQNLEMAIQLRISDERYLLSATKLPDNENLKHWLE